MVIKLDKPYQSYGTETDSRQAEIVAEANMSETISISNSYRGRQRYHPRLFNNSV
jgi:hypothetical protein